MKNKKLTSIKINNNDYDWFETERIISYKDGKKRKLLVSHQWGENKKELINQLKLMIEKLKK